MLPAERPGRGQHHSAGPRRTHSLTQTTTDSLTLMLSLDHLPDTWRTRRAGALAVTAVITLSLFSWLALTTSAGTGLAPHDQGITTWAADGRHPALTVVMQVFTALGSTVGLTVLTAICATLLFMRGHHVRALVLTVTMLGSSLLTVVLKEIFGRTRPSTDTLLGFPASTTSFPSGHSFNTAVFAQLRSEERRVGKECRSRWSPYH